MVNFFAPATNWPPGSRRTTALPSQLPLPAFWTFLRRPYRRSGPGPGSASRAYAATTRAYLPQDSGTYADTWPMEQACTNPSDEGPGSVNAA